LPVPPGASAETPPRMGSRVAPKASPILPASVAAIAIVSLATFAVVRHARTPRSTARFTEDVRPAAGEDPSSPTSRPVRHSLPSIPSSIGDGPAADPSSGPGSADAQSLAEELLSALQSADYDGFVAKGSASFRAALDKDRFDAASAQLAGRLSQGHRVSTMGSLRR